MNDNLIVFAKVKNASITINEEAYVIKIHKHGSCFMPYVQIDGYYRAVIIRIFRGEMFALVCRCEYSNIKEYLKSISLLEYFTKNIKNYEIDNLKATEIYEIRNSITKDMDDIKVVLCTKISHVNKVCSYSMKDLICT